VLKKLLPTLCGTVLAAAACGRPEIVVRAQDGQEQAFFTQVVDTEGAVGSGLSLATDAQGNPHMAYLAFTEPPAEGEPAAPPDPLAPILPAVQHAHLMEDIWTRGPVADDQQEMTEEDGTAIALDQEGVHHVVWTAGGQVLYSTNAEGEFQEEPEVVVEAQSAVGVSIGTDEQGEPIIAYVDELTEAEGPAALVRVATRAAKGWEVETAAEAGPGDPVSTAVASPGGEALVAYGSEGATQVARRGGARWTSEVVDPDGGLGVSLGLDADGNPHLAYLNEVGAVKHAHQAGEGWEVSDVGDGAQESPASIAVDQEGIHHVVWQTADGLAYASNAEGDFAEEELPPSTAGGARPRVGAGAEGAVYVAWYDAEETELQMATRTDDEPLLAVPSPEDIGGGTGPGAACEPEGTELSIAAQNLAFDTDCLAVEAGQAFTITLDNQDTVPHNVAIYPAPPPGEALFTGETFTGPATQTYEPEPIEEEGQLYFQCDVHPNMNGTFVVAGGEQGGGGGGGGGPGGGGGG
jgi:plastocyanin